MKNIKPILGIVLVFLLGAASGAFITNMYECSKRASITRGGSEARENMYMKRLTDKLDLSEQQQAQIRAIVHESYAEIRQIRKQYQPHIRLLLEQRQSRINTLLKPDQQTRFRQFTAEHTSHRSN